MGVDAIAGGQWRLDRALGVVVVVFAMFGGALTAGSAFAVGDANDTSCPASTESSPGFRAYLPDCRAYEIVSAANSGDTSTVTGSYGFLDGVHVFYRDFLPTPGAGARNGLTEPFVATRTSSGWVRRAISLPQGEGPRAVTLGVQTRAEPMEFSGDFSQAFVNSPYQDPFEDPRLDQTTGMGVYRLMLATGAVETLSLPDSGVLTQSMIETPECLAFGFATGCGLFLAGASADGSRAFFVTTAKLVTAPGTPPDTHGANDEVYERTGGRTYLVGVLPDGSVPVCGAEISQGISDTIKPEAYSYGAVAPSGTNVVFDANTCSEGGLFLRDVVHDSTVRLPGSSFAGRLGAGAGEEEKIFTLGENQVYEYGVGTGESTDIGEGSLLAFSSDGSRVYFLGNEEEIFVYHEGVTRPIEGTLGGYGAGPFGRYPGGLIANGRPTFDSETQNMPVASAGSSDGSHFLFIDTAKLTGYANKQHQEAYVYDAETGKVTCISCNPLGSEPEPQGGAQLINQITGDISGLYNQSPSPPFISDDGSRAVFETTEALVPQDVNGTEDVYEWVRVGSDGCTTASDRYSEVIEGCVYLLSSGLGKEVPNNKGTVDGTHLVGASENLQDVYILTSESLLPGVDSASKLYDVRVDGGFPYAPPTRGCEAEQCAAVAGAPSRLGRSATETFAGPGDVKSGAARGAKKVASVRKRRLARALRACRRRHEKRRRVACERVARRRFGTKANRGRRGGSR